MPLNNRMGAQLTKQFLMLSVNRGILKTCTYTGKSLQLVWQAEIDAATWVDSGDNSVIEHSADFDGAEQLQRSKVWSHEMCQFRQRQHLRRRIYVQHCHSDLHRNITTSALLTRKHQPIQHKKLNNQSAGCYLHIPVWFLATVLTGFATSL